MIILKIISLDNDINSIDYSKLFQWDKELEEYNNYNNYYDNRIIQIMKFNNELLDDKIRESILIDFEHYDEITLLSKIEKIDNKIQEIENKNDDYFNELINILKQQNEQSYYCNNFENSKKYKL